ncbi:radical SAM protein [Kitasatospora sp. NPDC004240]
MTTTDHRKRRPVHLIELTALPGIRYSITLGYLQAAAQQDPVVRAAHRFERHVHHLRAADRRRVFAEVLDRLARPASEPPFLVAFTVYFWNRAESLELAALIKERWPDCLVVLGGNDVTHQADALFAESPDVDVLVHGEGELRFAELLRELARPRPLLDRIAGISHRGPDGRVRTTPPAPRIADLAQVPSPLLSPVYPDADLASSWLIVYETNRGCPYSCAFCYWGGATNAKVRQFPLERIEAELDRIVRLAPDGASLFIADANFGLLPRDREIARILVDLCRRYDKRILVMTNWAKNTTDRVVEIARILHEAGLTGAITLSTQSFDPEVLEIANRSNIRPAHYHRMQQAFRELGIPTYTDLIWGLPGETPRTFLDGIEEVLRAGGSPVVYPLLLLNNTDFSHARFRTEQGLVTRRMPADISNPELVADVVVGHASMTEDEWRWGLELRLTLSLFQKVLLRCTLRRLHQATGARLVDLLDGLRALLFDDPHDLRGPHGIQDPHDPDALGPLHAEVRVLAADYRAGWRDPDAVDRTLLREADRDQGVPEELHYQAILRRLTVADPDALRRYLAGLVRALLRLPAGPSVPGGAPVDEAELDALLTADLAATAVLRTTLTGRPRQAVFTLPADVHRLLAESGDLPAAPAPNPGEEEPEAYRLVLRVPERWAHHPFSAYVLSVWHGSGHPLRDADPVTTPLRPALTPPPGDRARVSRAGAASGPGAV